MDNWIAVTEKLPDKHEVYVISGNCDFKTKRKEYKGYYHYSDKKWVTIDPPFYQGFYYRYINGVTHWKSVVHTPEEKQ